MRKLVIFFTGMMLFLVLQQTQAQQSISINVPKISGGNTNCLQMGTPVQQNVWVKNTGSMPLSWIKVRLDVLGDSTQWNIHDTIPTLSPGDSALVNLPYQVPNWSPYYLWVDAYGGLGVYDSVIIQECAGIEDLEIGFVSLLVGSPNAATPVRVYLKNNSSTKTYYTAILNWTINGVMQGSPMVYQNHSGLAPSGYDTLTIGMYYSINCTDEIKVWINNSQDNNPKNDTAMYVGQGCPPIITKISATMCWGGTYQFGNQTLIKAGIYVDSLPSSIIGVDSIVVLNLIVDSAYYKFINASICQGGLYNFRGKTLTTAGSYSDTVLNVSACDSIIVLNLTVIQPKTVSYYGYACQGGSYNFRGQTLTTSGTYYDTLQSTLGCDSIIFTLNLTIDTIPCNATIYVMVGHQDTACLAPVFVELYSVPNGGGQYILVDTATIANHSSACIFTNVAGGDYVIKAIPDSTENFLPTYYGNTEFWNLATIINIAYDTLYPAFIQLVPMPPFSNGSSSISGYVGKGKGYKSISQKSVNDPAEDINIYLQKEESTVWKTLAYTLTNTEGYFELKNVPIGKFRVMLDVAGIEMADIQIIEIKNDGENVQLKDYEVTEDGIIIKKGVGISTITNAELRITVYPNPTTGKLTIKNGSSTGSLPGDGTLSVPVLSIAEVVEVYDVVGQVVFTSAVSALSPETTIDISHLSNGMYFLKIDGKMYKVIKN